VSGLVSVVIPSYNRAHIVRESIDSVLAQSYGNVEALVIDDGSVDNTREVVGTYTDPRVRYFYKPNGGLSSARNFGLSVAKGEYIAFLDSDDAWRPWKIAAQVEIFRRHATVGLIWSDMSSFTDGGTILDERHLRTYYSVYNLVNLEETCTRPGALAELTPDAPADLADCPYYVGDIFSHMFIGNLVHPPTAIVRRERLRKSGPFEPEVTGLGAEDYHFYFRISELGPVAFLDAPSTLYRVHASQMSTCNALHEARGNLNVLRHWMARHPPNLDKSVIRHRLATSYGWLGAEELRAGNPRAAAPHLWRSLRLELRQPRAAALLIISLLPKGTLNSLRTWKRAMRRVANTPLVPIGLALSDADTVEQILQLVQPVLAQM
jgi:glycosyltransferase involved in cell wall biosynthesis